MIEKSLAGPIGVFVKFSTLQEYGVDKVFFLENENVDTSQRNVIFLARGDKATNPMVIAGMSVKGMICFLCSIYAKAYWWKEERGTLFHLSFIYMLGHEAGS